MPEKGFFAKQGDEGRLQKACKAYLPAARGAGA